MKIIFYLEI